MIQNTRKPDVKEKALKVKEMKQLQQNWLKQRAKSIEESALMKSTVHTGHNSLFLKTSSMLSQQKPKLDELVHNNRSQAKFHKWLKAKRTENADGMKVSHENGRQGNETKVYSKEKYKDTINLDQAHRGRDSDVNLLAVSSAINSPNTSIDPDGGWDSEDDTGEITAAQLCSPEDFETRADDIITKVRAELRSHQKQSSKPIELGGNSQQSAAGSSIADYNAGKQTLSSHVCPLCEKLMMPPDSSPMLLIPCGHTLCTYCCKKTRVCGLCGTSVQSSILNSVLQEIITGFHMKPNQGHHTYSGSKHAIKTDYCEEYQNLLTRQEILQDESGNIHRTVKQLTQKLAREQLQVENIIKKEKDIQSKIRSLQDELQQLMKHRDQYEKNCAELEIQSKQEKNRLLLVQDSLESISHQIEKVKLLAEDL